MSEEKKDVGGISDVIMYWWAAKKKKKEQMISEMQLSEFFADIIDEKKKDEDEDRDEKDETPKEGLTVEETWEKIKADPVWFIETYCMLEGKPFKLFGFQKEFIKRALENKYLIVNKSRQMGVSQVAGAFCLWYAMTKPKKEIIVISLNQSEAEYFMDKRVLEIYEDLPKFVRTKITRKASDEFKFANMSKINALANTKKALRGRSPNVVFIDEMAFQTQAQEMITSAMPALQMGEHLILVSTPNGTKGTGEFFYKTWIKASKGDSDFYPLKIKWYENPLYNDKAPEKVDWKDNKWAKSQSRNYTNQDSFKQEILGEFIDVAPEEQEETDDKGPVKYNELMKPQKPYDPPESVKQYWRDYIKD